MVHFWHPGRTLGRLPPKCETVSRQGFFYLILEMGNATPKLGNKGVVLSLMPTKKWIARRAKAKGCWGCDRKNCLEACLEPSQCLEDYVTKLL